MRIYKEPEMPFNIKESAKRLNMCENSFRRKIMPLLGKKRHYLTSELEHAAVLLCKAPEQIKIMPKKTSKKMLTFDEKFNRN